MAVRYSELKILTQVSFTLCFQLLQEDAMDLLDFCRTLFWTLRVSGVSNMHILH